MKKVIRKIILIFVLIITVLILMIILSNILFGIKILNGLGTYSTNKVCYNQSDCEGNRQAFCYYDKDKSVNLSGKCGLHLGCNDILDEEGNPRKVCVD